VGTTTSRRGPIEADVPRYVHIGHAIAYEYAVKVCTQYTIYT